MGNCSIQVLLADGATPSLLLLSPEFSGLRFSSQIHGGYRDCSFKISNIPIAVDYAELPYRGVVKVYSRTNKVCWQGRIEDRYGVRSADGSEYVEITAVGDYSRMNDQVYNRVFSDRRLSKWWFPDSTNTSSAYNGKHRSDLFKQFKNQMGAAHDVAPADVLGIAAEDGRNYASDWYAMWKYELPAGETVKKVTYSYETFFPRGNWRIGLFSETGNEIETGAGGGDDSRVTTTGSGTKSCTLNTPSRVVWLFMQAGPNSPYADLSAGMSYKYTHANYTFAGVNWAAHGGDGAKYQDGNNGYNLNQGTNATDYMEFTFTGTGVQLFGAYGTMMGIVTISVRKSSDSTVVYGPTNADLYDNHDAYGNSSAIRPSAKISEGGVHGLTYDTYILKVLMTNTKNASSSAKECWIDYCLVDQGVWAQFSNVVVYGATGNIYADTILKAALTAKCPDISTDQTHINSPAVSILDAAFESELRVSQIAEKLALLGDGSNNIWDVAVWDSAICYFAARPTTHTHRVQIENCPELRIGGSMKGVWNKVGGSYQNDHGTLTHTTESQDTKSQTLYGIRDFYIPMGNTDPTQALRLQATSLTAWKDPTGTSQITISGGLQDSLGVDCPPEEFRAGRILLVSGLIPHLGVAGAVDNRTVFFCKTVEYDDSTGRLSITPGDPDETIETELRRIGG